MQEYGKILHYHPEERDAWLELIELAERVGDEEMRSKYAALYDERFAAEAPGDGDAANP